MPAMKPATRKDLAVVYRPVESLIPYARNARVHSDEHVAQIAASIREFGWTNPVLLDGERGIVAGHGRVLAARKLGQADVPCIELGHLTPAQKRAYVLADNKIALNAGWDDDLLRVELGELGADGFDLGLVGFSAEEVAALMGASGPLLGDPDDTPEAPDEADVYVKTGDVYTLGRHRILCGDSTNADDVARVMGGERAALCLTDPPFGVELGTRRHQFNGTRPAYESTEDAAQDLAVLIAGFLPLAQSVSGVVLLTPGLVNQRLYPAPTWTLAWFAPGVTGINAWGFCCWQPVFAYGADPYPAAGLKDRRDAFSLSAPTDAALAHPCPKPLAVWSWLLERGSTSQRDVVFDPLSGSGTTIIACEQTGRSCRAIEIAPRYVQVAVERWEKLTGKKASKEPAP